MAYASTYSLSYRYHYLIGQEMQKTQILQEILSGTNLINETFVVSFVVGELPSRSVKQS